MNRAVIIGRITHELELKQTNSGQPVCSFSVAVDRRKKGETDFISCVAWGPTAEITKRYCHKGSKVCVAGHITVRSFEKDGVKRTVTEINADEVEFLDAKKEEKIEDWSGDIPFLR